MLDLLLLGLIAISALLGLIRGLLATVLGVASWGLAAWAALLYGESAAQFLSAGSPAESGDYIGGYLLVFIGVLLVMALLGMLLRGVVNATVLLKWPDRLLGLGLGTLRGVLLAVLAVFALGFSSMREAPAWRQSVVLPWLQPMADWLREQLPKPSQSPAMSLMDLGKSVLAGDNGGPNESDAGSGLLPALLEQVGNDHRQRAGQDNPVDPAGALPSNIDPAQVRPGQPDPTRVEVHGQARPPSR
ncbi:CvpA family protein [Stenotrophomonas sp. SY1]|uniref:CvpA family protein n=1 Tax=Stenotrophomonas sp. SY1 TaxID=477235 RepID=UPI001E337510|nr:CvpA family protein [Stenotrophomonas sp. SY1]